jgi:hypothetical protein
VASFNVNRFVRLKHPISLPYCRSSIECSRTFRAGTIARGTGTRRSRIIQVSGSRCGLGSAREIEHGQFRRHFLRQLIFHTRRVLRRPQVKGLLSKLSFASR